MTGFRSRIVVCQASNTRLAMSKENAFIRLFNGSTRMWSLHQIECSSSEHASLIPELDFRGNETISQVWAMALVIFGEPDGGEWAGR